MKRFVEEILGIDPVAAGEDTAWRVQFSLGWPDWVVVLFCAFAVLFVVAVYLREGSAAARPMKLFLASLRLAVMGMVLLMLSGLELAIDRTGLPYLVFMIDDSESMQVRDRMPGAATADQPPTRIRTVRDWLTASDGEKLRELTAKHKLRFYLHSAAPRHLGTFIKPEEISGLLTQLGSLEAKGGESRLGGNLRDVLNDLRGTPPSAVVFVTDGVTTAGEPVTQAAQYAARKNIPVFTIGVGSPAEVRDLRLHDLLVDNVVFVDDVVTFDVKVSGAGYADGEATIALRQKGQPAVLDEQKVRLPGDGKPARVRLAHNRPTVPGVIQYTIETPVQDEELNKSNNLLEKSVEVVKQKVRVLYVEAYPRYEFRYLKNLLEREPTVELKVLLLDSDPQYIEQDKAAIGFFPTTKEELHDNFDVVIFGDVSPTFFSQVQLENLRDFVRLRGGGFAVLAGRQSAPQSYSDSVLEDLLPVEVGSLHAAAPANTAAFAPQLTLEGRSQPIFRFAVDPEENRRIWESLPPLFWYAPSERTKAAAQVFVVHPTEQKNGAPVALAAAQFYGAGRTYYQAFDSTWRWRYRAEDFYHSRYWIQVVRFLSRSKLLGGNQSVEIALEQPKFRRGEAVPLRVRFLDEKLAPKGDDEEVAVVIERDGQASQNVSLKRVPGGRNLFESTFAQSEDGRYRVRLAEPFVENAPTAEFVVEPPPGELDRVQMNEPELRQVADLTAAAYFPIRDADKLYDELPAGRRVALHTDAPIALWNTWPILLLFCALLALEWVLRKRCQML